MQVITTTYQGIYHMALATGNSVAICGTRNSQCKMVIYNIEHGRECGSTMLEECPEGMTGVTLAGTHCLALSYRYYLTVFV